MYLIDSVAKVIVSPVIGAVEVCVYLPGSVASLALTIFKGFEELYHICTKNLKAQYQARIACQQNVNDLQTRVVDLYMALSTVFYIGGIARYLIASQETVYKKRLGDVKYAETDQNYYNNFHNLSWVSKNTNPELDHAIGLMHLKYNNKDEARSAFNKASNSGHLESLYELGKIYQSEDNAKAARILFEKAALRGHLESQFRLGCMLDLEEAKRDMWLEIAADTNYGFAQNIVANRYFQKWKTDKQKNDQAIHKAVLYYGKAGAHKIEPTNNVAKAAQEQLYTIYHMDLPKISNQALKALQGISKNSAFVETKENAKKLLATTDQKQSKAA